MKLFKNWKKAAVLMMTGVMLTSTPAMAHGHHSGSHHGGYSYSYTSTGTYCSYHCTTHKNAKNCKYYCTKHHKTHKNGRCH